MMIPTSLFALSQALFSAFSAPDPTSSTSSLPSIAGLISPPPSTLPFPSPYRPLWSGELPPNAPIDKASGASVSACTFALGPPGPPASALCPAFNAYCSAFRDDYKSRHIAHLKTRPALSSKLQPDDQDPLRDVAFRSGCTGGAGTASDGTYLSGYTATCVVDGVDWVPFVMDQFLRAEFGEEGREDGPLPVYASFVGCQVPAHTN